MQKLETINQAVVDCTDCPRLIAYCREVARTKKRAYHDDDYWGKPVPGFGDPAARLLIVGLAPAAHGANRTGRMFTGDGTDGMGSADFLARVLHRFGIASQPTSRQRGDGLTLQDAYLSAIVRCAPPANRPTREEIANCAQHLQREMEALSNVRAILALGKLAFDQVLRAFGERGVAVPRPRPKFGHSVVVHLGDDLPVLVGSYHPSRQNTQTGRLTESMFGNVIELAQMLASGH